MILDLRVRGVATVEDVTVPLGPGLNVLTGETGAGKSMLVDALGLLLGARADVSALRPGVGKAVVEAVFDEVPALVVPILLRLGIPCDGEPLILKREVSSEGRSRAWVQGSPVTIAALAEVGGLLVDLHGQHETQSLVRPAVQRTLLDAVAEAAPAAGGLADAVHERDRLAGDVAALEARQAEVGRRSDSLQHTLQEIDQAAPVPGEDSLLDLEARQLGHAEALRAHAAGLMEILDGEDGSASSALAAADRTVAAIERLDPSVSPWREILDTVHAGMDELVRAVTVYAAGMQEDPGRLAEVEQRRDALDRLKRKYGATLEQVLETRSQVAEELDLLHTADLDLRRLRTSLAQAEERVGEAARTLSALRSRGASRLTRAVNNLLPGLGFVDGEFVVVLTPRDRPTVDGAESVSFFVRLNVGHELQPLHRVASGGEVSRLMLAIKVALAAHDEVPTLIFDEIDQGIGGEIAVRVAHALADVSCRHQVLVITHLPPIAARAHRHLVVVKNVVTGVASSQVRVVEGDERVTEMARMLGDARGATARRHARTLLGEAVGRSPGQSGDRP